MKLSRIAGAGAVAALVAASTLLSAGAAQAAEVYVTPGDIGTEVSPYPAGWFAGNVTAPAGTVAAGGGGLVITGGTGGGYQLLNGTPGAGTLVSLAGSAQLFASGPATFQIPVFGEGTSETEFTTLRPAAPNTLSGDWITSRPIGATYAANDQAPLADLEAALSVGEPYTILAFGAFVDPNTTATLHSIVWNGNTYFFAPAATITLTPTTISQADFTNAAKGVTLTATGFLPGEDIVIAGDGPESTGLISQGELVADANGAVTYTFSAPGETPALGAYTLFVTGDTTGVQVSASFTVVANTLPEAGVDASGIALLAGAMLLAGAGVFALRRRTAAE